jgi:tRNA wybutosine-synthesizing protein 2
VKRVWGWELNGWSVEGLRRGCLANKWGCRVVKVTDDGKLDGGEDIEDLVKSLTDTDRVVIFHGDNRFAADMLDTISHVMDGMGTWNPVRHVNLGLLPSSQPSWENACGMLDVRRGGWIHVHENVDVHQIEQKKKEIEHELARVRSQEQTPLEQPIANCRHVEHVKTYAPGVMHCVFDARLSGTDSAFMIYHNS